MFWHIFALSLSRFGSATIASPVLMMQFETITESQRSISIHLFALSGLLSILIPEINALLHPRRKIVKRVSWPNFRSCLRFIECAIFVWSRLTCPLRASVLCPSESWSEWRSSSSKKSGAEPSWFYPVIATLLTSAAIRCAPFHCSTVLNAFCWKSSAVQ